MRSTGCHSSFFLIFHRIIVIIKFTLTAAFLLLVDAQKQ